MTNKVLYITIVSLSVSISVGFYVVDRLIKKLEKKDEDSRK